MTTIAERVAAGAAFLDEHDPGWWKPDAERAIDLDALDIEEPGSCILGQRCPLEMLVSYVGGATVYAAEPGPESYWGWAGYHAFGRHLQKQADARGLLFNWATRYGFAAEFGAYPDVTDEWRRVIVQRRAAP